MLATLTTEINLFCIFIAVTTVGTVDSQRNTPNTNALLLKILSFLFLYKEELKLFKRTVLLHKKKLLYSVFDCT